MNLEQINSTIEDVKGRFFKGEPKAEDVGALLEVINHMSHMGYIEARIRFFIKQLEDAKSFPVIEDLGRHFLNTRNLYELLTELSKPVYHVLNRLKMSTVPEALRDLGTTNIKLVNLGIQLILTQTTNAKMLDKDACIKWLKENDLPDIVQENVNHQTLSSLAKTFAEEGKDLPEELFEVRAMDNTSVRKL